MHEVEAKRCPDSLDDGLPLIIAVSDERGTDGDVQPCYFPWWGAAVICFLPWVAYFGWNSMLSESFGQKNTFTFNGYWFPGSLGDGFPDDTATVGFVAPIFFAFIAVFLAGVGMIFKGDSGIASLIPHAWKPFFLLFYMCLDIGHISFGHDAGKNYSKVQFFFCVSFVKLLITCILLALWEAKNVIEYIRTFSLSEFFETRKHVFLGWYGIVSFCYLTYDVMVLKAAANMRPATTAVLMNVRGPLIALLWQATFNEKLSKQKLYAIFVIAGGTALYSYMSASDNADGADSLIGLGYIGVAVVCNVFASVLNEKQLKNAEVHALVQNIVMYSSAMMLSFTYLIITGEGTGINFDMFTQYPQNLGIFILSTLGITVAFFIKYFGNIVKIVTSGCTLLLYIPMQYIRGGGSYSVSAVQGVGLMIVASGICAFAMAKK